MKMRVFIMCVLVLGVFVYVYPVGHPLLEHRFAPSPPGGITFHVSVIPNEIEMLVSVGWRVLYPLRQCFSVISVAVDLPHGGKTYGPTREDDPIYLPVVETNTTGLVERVYGALAEMVRVHETHCGVVPIVVELLNHTTLAGWMRVHFDIEGPATREWDIAFGDVRPDLPLQQRFFKNTVMYVRSIVTASTKYILHTDVDTIGLWNPKYYDTTFVNDAIQLLQRDDGVVFVRPARECMMHGKSVMYEDWMSCRLFVTETHTFSRMVPFKYWASHVEDMFHENMALHGLVAAMLPLSRPCFTSTWFQRKVLHVY